MTPSDIRSSVRELRAKAVATLELSSLGAAIQRESLIGWTHGIVEAVENLPWVDEDHMPEFVNDLLVGAEILDGCMVGEGRSAGYDPQIVAVGIDRIIEGIDGALGWDGLKGSSQAEAPTPGRDPGREIGDGGHG